eukprot:CAMPEP_0178673192 /NCGR_PEP_ID=MMETSP0698-20121128/34171_1 /TAXON_ID=265572 /ORGANISM="Extubocellulus spinifer, Strain CCMP396" /LENGTH=104 /DNA_ID=CAMNT_0020317187 /DNA_START=455 /DNA_END=769 /DNA_ORIENTATION=+
MSDMSSSSLSVTLFVLDDPSSATLRRRISALARRNSTASSIFSSTRTSGTTLDSSMALLANARVLAVSKRADGRADAVATMMARAPPPRQSLRIRVSDESRKGM